MFNSVGNQALPGRDPQQMQQKLFGPQRSSALGGKIVENLNNKEKHALRTTSKGVCSQMDQEIANNRTIGQQETNQRMRQQVTQLRQNPTQRMPIGPAQPNNTGSKCSIF